MDQKEIKPQVAVYQDSKEWLDEKKKEKDLASVGAVIRLLIEKCGGKI